jgi:hypothetical protein
MDYLVRGNIQGEPSWSLKFVAGYSYGYTLDPAMVSFAPGGSAGANGYWMQPFADSRT